MVDIKAPAEPVLPIDTCGDLLINALCDAGIIGIDESPEQPIINRAFRQANWKLAQWARKRWMCYRLQDYSFVSTGAFNYAVGPGQTINISPRPDRLEYAFVRFLNGTQSGGIQPGPGPAPGVGSPWSSGFSPGFGPLGTGTVAPAAGNPWAPGFSTGFGPLAGPTPPNPVTPIANGFSGNLPVDIQLDIIQSHEDYSRIAVKNVGTIPYSVFYDPSWPIGVLFPWPVPQASLYEIHIGLKVVLPRFNSLQERINFPPEFEAALNWSLARVFRASYQMPEDSVITALARDAVNVLRLAGQQSPTLQLPREVMGRGRAYDYRSDSSGY